MKDLLQGLTAGVLIGTLLTGGAGFEKNSYGLQLKIMSDKSDESGWIGIGNITVR